MESVPTFYLKTCVHILLEIIGSYFVPGCREFRYFRYMDLNVNKTKLSCKIYKPSCWWYVWVWCVNHRGYNYILGNERSNKISMPFFFISISFSISWADLIQENIETLNVLLIWIGNQLTVDSNILPYLKWVENGHIW